MKWLIALLTAATGILHLLLGFGLLGGGGTQWLLVLNGIGYLVLLFLYWTSAGQRRGTIRWILLAYTLITLIGYFVLQGSGGLQFTLGLIVKAIELLLIILLFLDRGSDTVPVAPPAPTRTSAVVSSSAYQAAAGVGAASTAAAVGAATMADQVVDEVGTVTWPDRAAEIDLDVDTTTSGLDEWREQAMPDVELAGETGVSPSAGYEVTAESVADEDSMLEEIGEGIDDTVDEAGAALGAAAAWVGDKVDDAGDALSDAGDSMADAAGDAVDATGDALSDAGGWVGDKVDDAGDALSDTGDRMADAAGDAVDATGAALGAAGAAVGAAVAGVGDGMEDHAVVAGQVRSEPTTAELRAELEDYLRTLGGTSEFHKPIEYIEGIGQAFGAKLRAVGVVTVLDLMVEGSTRLGRKHLADRSGLSASQILTWVNHIDLFRIKGVAQEYADLLEQSGVDTVVELAQRNPNNLFKRMNEINAQKELVRRLPRLGDVQSWVEQAKSLKRLVHY